MKLKGHLLLGCVFISALYLLLIFADAGKTHWLTPFKYGIYSLSIIPVPLVIVAIPIALYGSVLPDLDTVKSKIFVSTLSFLLIIGCYSFCIGLQIIFYLVLIILLLQIFLVVLGHRKLTHKFSFALIYALILGFVFFDFYLALFAFVGYNSHLVGDKFAGKK